MDLFFILLCSSFTIIQVASKKSYGILYGENSDNSDYGYYCATYDPDFKTVPRNREDTKKLPLVDLSSDTFCDEPVPPPQIDGAVAAVARGNCTFSTKALIVQKYGGEMLLTVSKTGLHVPTGNESDYHDINITVALMEDYEYQQLKGLGKKVFVQLYSPDTPNADYNLLLIWAMAVGTILVGAWWSGHVKYSQMIRKRKKSEGDGSAKDTDVTIKNLDEEDEDTFDVNPKILLIFVVLMCVMLVSLYFLYDYLVYIIITLFTVASSAALYSCCKPLLLRIPCLPNTRIPFSIRWIGQPEIRRVVLAVLCMGVGIWWAIERNKDYAWILQDILGMVFCINMMKTVRLPSFKACTILLTLLFFYDIFFVFITPLFTKSGHSVMVEVATGGDSTSGEQLPLVLKVPRFASSVLSVCSLPYSLLGFGDILVPGLLVSYCCGFDLKVQTGKVYYISTVIAYGIGLVITFLALALMNSGQPALLYLVPCTLLTVVVLGWKRGELRLLWTGELNPAKAKLTNQPKGPQRNRSRNQARENSLPVAAQASSGPATLPVSSTSTAGPASAAAAAAGGSGGEAHHLDSGSAVSDNDQQMLIRKG